MGLNLGVDRVNIEPDKVTAPGMPQMNTTQALAIIQRNERGRQGKARALLMKELREEEKQRRWRMERCYGCCVFDTQLTWLVL